MVATVLTRVRIPLAVKVYLVCTGLAFAVSLAASTVLYRGAVGSLRQATRDRLEAIAATAALQIDPNLHQMIRARPDESSEAYRRIKAVLTEIRDANPEIRYVHTMRATKVKNVWQFIVDAETDPGSISHVGDKYDVGEYPEMQKAFSGPSADEEPTEDEAGIWLSGYAPIRDSRNRVQGIVGLNMSLEELLRKEMELRESASQNVTIALLISMLLSLFITKLLMRPVRTFTGAAERVQKGDLEFQVELRARDEIGKFAATFNRMIVSLRESRKRLIEQSTLDVLTGLCNHTYFHERLSAEVERANRYSRPLCLLILDIDRFKTVNDSYGYLIGDSVLKQFAEVLRQSLRSIDVAARYGGDEFAVILLESSKEEGQLAAERIRDQVAAHSFYAVGWDELQAARAPSERLQLTASIGFATFPDDHSSADGIVMAADIALCHARQLGRNSVSSYDADFGGEERVDPEELYRVLHNPDVAAVRSLAAAVDARDPYTAGHSERVAMYALDVGQALGMESEELEALKMAGLLHDLGKIGVPDAILNKPDGLTEGECEAIEQHTSIGASILRRAPQLEQIVPAVLSHHERWDGTGYPEGLSGDSIPLGARILAVADAFDAMTSARPYRQALPADDALLELRANAGKQFDPELVEAFSTRMSSTFEQQKAA